MQLCRCGKFYFYKEGVCPYCEYSITKNEWRRIVAEAKQQIEAQQHPQNSPYAWYSRSYCSHCGQLLPAGSSFCPRCGVAITNKNYTLPSTINETQLIIQEKADPKYHEIRKKYEQERKEADKKIVSAVLISTTNQKSALNTAGRAIVGGALLGPVGLIAGAASGSSHTTTATFSVKYASGRIRTETVAINSNRFNELSAYLHK